MTRAVQSSLKKGYIKTMATYQITYKPKFHHSIVRADLHVLARLTEGKFTHDSDSIGTVTCPESYEWVIAQAVLDGKVQTFTKK